MADIIFAKWPLAMCRAAFALSLTGGRHAIVGVVWPQNRIATGPMGNL